MLRIFVLLFLSFCICPSPSLTQPIEITTAYQESYPKYYRFSDDSTVEQINGLCIDIIRAIEETVPIKITAPIGLVPFKRIQQQLANNTITIFVGMAQNDRRRKQYIFIETPLYAVHHVIAVRAEDTVKIQSFDDIRALAPDNVILTNSGTATERFLQKQDNLTVDAGGISLQANLKKLLKKRGRFYYFHDLGLLGAITQYDYREKITVLPTSFKKYYHYIALAPNTPQEVVDLIDSAVQQLTASGELARIVAQYTNTGKP